MLWLNWKLTLLSLVMTPLIVGVVRMVSIRLRNSSRAVQGAMGDVTQVLQEAIEGHKVVKLFGGQRYEEKRFLRANQQLRGYNMRQAIAAAERWAGILPALTSSYHSSWCSLAHVSST